MIKTRIIYALSFILVFLAVDRLFSQGGEFPVGVYWVKNSLHHEKPQYYWQVEECGFNIVVGGSDPVTGFPSMEELLDSAETHGIVLILDGTESDSVDFIHDQSVRTHHYTYESTGYESYSEYPRLQDIEGPIIYYFDHEVPVDYVEPDNGAEPDRKDRQNSWKVNAPGSAGYMLWNYNGRDWLESGRYYYVKFRLKINGDLTSHDQVARIECIRLSDGVALDQLVIYSDDFANVGNMTYKEFQLSFNANRNKQPAEESSLSAMLPTGEEMVIDYEDIDFRIYWYGEVTLWVDNIKAMNATGRTLFSGSKDTDIINEVADLHAYDSDHNTLIGFYQDEPPIWEIEPIHYLSNLEYQGAPVDIKNVIMQPSISAPWRGYTRHQYLNMGSPETYQSRYLLSHTYPIRPDTAPVPGDAGYNDYIQDKWESYLIPELDDSRYVATLNGVPFWYWMQAHNWPGSLRDPYPKEIRAMASLGLAYGTKGIWYFLYTSINSVPCIGLVSEDFIPNDKWYEAQAINNDLQAMTPDILHLNWQSAFTSGDVVPDGSFVQGISGADYIEIANFQHESTGEEYFFLVNRKTENVDTQILSVELESNTAPRNIVDVIAARQG